MPSMSGFPLPLPIRCYTSKPTKITISPTYLYKQEIPVQNSTTTSTLNNIEWKFTWVIGSCNLFSKKLYYDIIEILLFGEHYFISFDFYHWGFFYLVNVNSIGFGFHYRWFLLWLKTFRLRCPSSWIFRLCFLLLIIVGQIMELIGEYYLTIFNLYY